MNTAHRLILQLKTAVTPELDHPKYRTIRANVGYGLACLLLSAVAACGGGDSSGGITAPPVPVTLSFTLQQVNGQGLPATFQASEGIIVITSGTMQLRPDKSFAENIVYNFTPTGGSMESDAAIVSGTYTQTGSDIVFTIPPEGADPGSTFSGTVLDNTLSYNDAGFVAVYSR